jgi:hypothetical protein
MLGGPMQQHSVSQTKTLSVSQLPTGGSIAKSARI